jgi:hypothetical protein
MVDDTRVNLVMRRPPHLADRTDACPLLLLTMPSARLPSARLGELTPLRVLPRKSSFHSCPGARAEKCGRAPSGGWVIPWWDRGTAILPAAHERGAEFAAHRAGVERSFGGIPPECLGRCAEPSEVGIQLCVVEIRWGRFWFRH